MSYSNPWDTWTGIDWSLSLKFAGKHFSQLGHRFFGTYAAEFTETNIAALAEPPNGIIQACWVGHATVLIQIAGKTILVDPMFGASVPPGISRSIPPPFPLQSLPRVDAVLISHNHYDHLDHPTIVELNRLFQPLFLCPAGLAQWFLDSGVAHVEEMRWWDERALDGCHIVFVPAQHWSRRGLFDMNKSWWGGWVVKSNDPALVVYHAGDTGYCPCFTEIGQRLGPIDLSFVPIGPVEPRQMMAQQHVGPVEAVRIHKDVRSRRSVAIHWGTFSLGFDLPADPARGLLQAAAEGGLSPDEFTTAPIGELIRVGPAASASAAAAATPLAS